MLETEFTEFLDTATAARLLGISKPTMRRWLQRGHIPAVRTLGGWYRVPAVTVMALAQPRRLERLGHVARMPGTVDVDTHGEAVTESR